MHLQDKYSYISPVQSSKLVIFSRICSWLKSIHSNMISKRVILTKTFQSLCIPANSIFVHDPLKASWVNSEIPTYSSVCYFLILVSFWVDDSLIWAVESNYSDWKHKASFSSVSNKSEIGLHFKWFSRDIWNNLSVQEQDRKIDVLFYLQEKQVCFLSL